MSTLDEVQAMRARGATAEYLEAARELAAREPGDVEAQIEAAYACDRYGDEADAIVYYDAAWALGVPGDRRRFLVGYGSTLRNVGRLDDAIAVLEEAIDAYPAYPALPMFLALALESAGRSAEALARAIEVVIDTAGDRLDGYDRALRHYAADLDRR